MIPVESLLYKIDTKLNKLATLEHQEIPIENKILAVNEAQLKLVKIKLDPNNPLGLGLDAFKKRYEDLEVLVEPASAHPLDVTLEDTVLNRWTSNLIDLDPTYMFYLDSYIICTKGSCKNKTVYVNKDLVKHADIAELTLNPNYKPSFEYEETFCTLSSNKLEVYTDGTFTPTRVYISYIRYPKYIDYPGYVRFDGSDSTKQDSELPAYLEDELIDYTIRELAMSTENNPAVQYTQERIRTSE